MAKTLFFESFPCARTPLLLIVSLFLAMSACNMLERRADDILLAKAYNNRLYYEDIHNIIPQGASPADSAAIIQRYVDRWIQQQVFLYHAMQRPPAQIQDFEQRVTDYRNALIIHAYENELTRQEMDTLVTEEEINRYYEQNIPHFTLKDNIIQANYVKMPLTFDNHSIVRSLYRTGDDDQLQELENFCLENAATYYIGRDSWMVFNDILADMPLDLDDQATYLRNNRFAEITDDHYRYFLYIHDYRLKGDVSPVDFERENIRMLIMGRRKQEFIQEKRRELINKATEASRIETYY